MKARFNKLDNNFVSNFNISKHDSLRGFSESDGSTTGVGLNYMDIRILRKVRDYKIIDTNIQMLKEIESNKIQSANELIGFLNEKSNRLNKICK